MIELLIPRIEFRENINTGLNIINIKDYKLFRDCYFNFDENIILTDLGKDVKKEIIKNALEIELNDKKSIALLYKEIYRNIKKLNEVQVSIIFEKLKEIIYNSLINLINSEVEVNDIDFNKMLQSFNICYKSDLDFILLILSYIKTRCFHTNNNVFIFFNLSSVLSAKEMELLDIETQKLKILIVDITTVSNDRTNFNVMTIDEDLCII